MADTNSTPAPASTPKGKHTHPRGDIAQDVITDVALAKKVNSAAKVPDRLTALAARQITATDTGALDGLITNVEDTRMPDVVTKKHNARLATVAEGKAKTALDQALDVILNGVKRSYPGDKAQAAAYTIGHLPGERKEFEADVKSLVARAQAATLKGVTPADCQAVLTALTNWIAADDAQQAANDLYSTANNGLRQATNQINTSRRDIQYAADLVWPWDKPDSAPHRLAFGLPPKQKFSASNVKAPA